jgi:hypothetical protein
MASVVTAVSSLLAVAANDMDDGVVVVSPRWFSVALRSQATTMSATR